MDEIEIADVITAIGDAEFEGFIASTLHSHGWSITLRALDFRSLDEYLDEAQDRKVVLIYSSDLPGLTPVGVRSLNQKVSRSFGFSSLAQSDELYPEILQRPQSDLELISQMRGNSRTPHLRKSKLHSSRQRRAKVIGVGSVGRSTGATTLALNLAYEGSLLSKRTLLIDGHYTSPSIATLLNERNLTQTDTWKGISPNLFAAEITQDNLYQVLGAVEEATSDFDFIVIDMGSLRGFTNLLSDRRWGSHMIAWCADRADLIYVTTTLDVVALSQLRELTSEIGKLSIEAKVNFALMDKPSKKRKAALDSTHSQALHLLESSSVIHLPLDTREVQLARDRQLPLEQTNERGTVRRSIAALAQGHFAH